jgi:hypothetical protein
MQIENGFVPQNRMSPESHPFRESSPARDPLLIDVQVMSHDSVWKLGTRTLGDTRTLAQRCSDAGKRRQAAWNPLSAIIPKSARRETILISAGNRRMSHPPEGTCTVR